MAHSPHTIVGTRQSTPIHATPFPCIRHACCHHSFRRRCIELHCGHLTRANPIRPRSSPSTLDKFQVIVDCDSTGFTAILCCASNMAAAFHDTFEPDPGEPSRVESSGVQCDVMCIADSCNNQFLLSANLPRRTVFRTSNQRRRRDTMLCDTIPSCAMQFSGFSDHSAEWGRHTLAPSQGNDNIKGGHSTCQRKYIGHITQSCATFSNPVCANPIRGAQTDDAATTLVITDGELTT